MIILTNDEIQNQAIKSDVKVSHFKSHSEYSKQLSFEDFGDNLFLTNPKSKAVESYCYVTNPLGGKDRALKDNADFPLIVYIDIDFKNENQKKTFEKDLKKFGITKEILMKNLKLDPNIWISGNSRGGEGIHIYSIIFNKWAFENKFQDYSQIHKDNSMEFLKYLEGTYGLKFYHNDEIDYIDDAPINNMVLKSFGCLLNDNSNVNLNCNIFLNDKILKFIEKIYDKNIENLSTEDIDFIEPHKFTHYDPIIMGNAKYADVNTRMLFYKKYKKYYTGDGKELLKGLESFSEFEKYLEKLKMNYSIPLNNWASELEKMIDNFDYKLEETSEDENNIITNDIYKKLPLILQDLTKDFQDEKRDVVLLSTMICLGYYFSNIKFDYFFNSNQYNNFYLFVIANSSSGKSVMNNAKKLLYDIEKYHREKFSSEMLAYNAQLKKIGSPPQQIVVTVGGDATRQGLYKYLNNNNGKLVLFDTEADSMMMQKGDFDYSTLLRKSLQNESVTKSLAGSEQMYIETPKLNVCVSGTKSQLLNVINENGGENGTFNRFLFYTWDTPPSVESPHGKLSGNLFENYSKVLCDFYMENLYLDGLMQFEFTDYQVRLFDNELFKMHKKYVSLEDDSVSGIVKRHFLIAKKLCVTIAGLRIFDEYKKDREDPWSIKKEYDFSNLQVTDEDLLNVINIIKILIKDSMNLFRKFTPTEENTPKTSWKMDIYELLPDKFNRKQALQLGAKFKKCEKTIDRFTKNKENFNYNTITRIYTKKGDILK